MGHFYFKLPVIAEKSACEIDTYLESITTSQLDNCSFVVTLNLCNVLNRNKGPILSALPYILKVL